MSSNLSASFGLTLISQVTCVLFASSNFFDKKIFTGFLGGPVVTYLRRGMGFITVCYKWGFYDTYPKQNCIFK